MASVTKSRTRTSPAAEPADHATAKRPTPAKAHPARDTSRQARDSSCPARDTSRPARAAGRPISPKQAARRRDRVDALLDADLFKALSDPTRLLLLRCLLKCRRACSVSEVAQCCDVDFSVVARHLGVLARAGVLDARKQGRTVWYQARAEALSETFHELSQAIGSLTPISEWACCGPACCDGGDDAKTASSAARTPARSSRER